MLHTHDVDRVGTRRILACPHCRRLQSIIPRLARFSIVCQHCGRVFRVTEAGDVAVVEVAPVADGAATSRSPGARLRAMLGGLRSVTIVVLALGAVFAATRLLMGPDPTSAAGRRPLLEGSLTAPAEDMARVLARERDRRREALARYDRHLAAAAGDASAQALWRDLKRRDSEEVQLLDRHLAEAARASRAPAGFARDQP